MNTQQVPLISTSFFPLEKAKVFHSFPDTVTGTEVSSLGKELEMRGGKGPGEGQSERQKIRIGQLGKGVGGALGQLINQGLPAVALSPKKTNKQNQQKPARRGLGRRMSQTHLQRKSSWRESLKIPSRDRGSLLTECFSTFAGGGMFLGELAGLLGAVLHTWLP